MSSPPIALFCFRRPDHLQRTLAALAANEGAARFDLVAFSDGPRRVDEEGDVSRVRQVLDEWRSRSAFRSFSIQAQPANLGLRRSVVRGVSQLCNEAGSVIVVEDDLVTSPYFLRYCEHGLMTYAACENVASIHGYSYPVTGPLPETFFLRGADCWGWATWRRAWQVYDDDASVLLARIDAQALGRRFDYGGSIQFRKMLVEAQSGKIDSWAIRWHASAFLAGMLTLYPGRSLVRNIGLDSSGTHCADGRGLDGPVMGGPLYLEPLEVKEDAQAWMAFAQHFRGLRPSAWDKFISNAQLLLGVNR